MLEKAGNHLRILRKYRYSSIAQAAADVPCDPETLRKYEIGDTECPANVLKRLELIYGAPGLAATYAIMSCEVMRDYVPMMPTENLAQVFLTAQAAGEDVEGMESSIRRICADGAVDAQEARAADEAIREILEDIGAGFALAISLMTSRTQKSTRSTAMETSAKAIDHHNYTTATAMAQGR